MMVIMPPRTIHIKGIKNKVGSNFILSVLTIIKAGKVVCIKNLEIDFPSFSEIKSNFLIKKPIVAMPRVIKNTLLV